MFNFNQHLTRLLDMGRRRGKKATRVERGKAKIDKPTTITPPPVAQNQQLVKPYGGFQFEDEETDYAFDDYHHELSEALEEIRRVEAASFVRVSARYLDSFISSYSLLECFDWGDSRQGYSFWEECYHELISVGYQDDIDVEFAFWGVEDKDVDKAKKDLKGKPLDDVKTKPRVKKKAA